MLFGYMDPYRNSYLTSFVAGLLVIVNELFSAGLLQNLKRSGCHNQYGLLDPKDPY